MGKNINSFAENMRQTVVNQTNHLALLTAMQKAITSNDTFVTFGYEDANGMENQYQLPSYVSVVNRLKSVEESINSLTNGNGVVNITDGTRRVVKLQSVPQSPQQVVAIPDPSTFTIDANWFFEDFMFPSVQVSLDLTNQIEDTADRVQIVRVILDATTDQAQTIWANNLAQNNYDYSSLLAVLSNAGVEYSLDKQVVELPLVSNQFQGSFQVTEDPKVIDGNAWFHLDTITYATFSQDGINQGQNNILSLGDILSYANSLFEIVGIDQNTMMVRLKRISGVANPGVYSVFTYYENPFRSKVINVKFGAHEYNIIYVKGIAEDWNLLADSWSTPIKFATDSLLYENQNGVSTTNFLSYYNRYIMDWGANMLAEAKQAHFNANSGKIPNVPTLYADDLRVVQINLQINAAIDNTDVKNTASEIESVKSQIKTLKSTIAAQKNDLQNITNTYSYNALQQQIATNTTDLENLQTTYTTLVNSFQTMVRENSAVTVDPKYHIRGFFPIPPYKYHDADETIAEEIIGFDIMYRYIKEDNTGTQLNTFDYTDTDGETKIQAVFTDWLYQESAKKEQVLTEDGRYIWKAENVADGTEVNINQIDIPISKGEKVEIKVRSISEAGFSTNNCLKSDWSDSVIIEFPPTLSTTNEIADLIKEINDDALVITIQNTLDSQGVTTHLDDTIPNTNSVNGLYFKHKAENIAYEDSYIGEDGGSETKSISIQEKIENLEKSILFTSPKIYSYIQDVF